MSTQPIRRRSLFEKDPEDNPGNCRNQLKEAVEDYVSLLDSLPDLQLSNSQNVCNVQELIKEKNFETFDLKNYFDVLNQCSKRCNAQFKEMKSIKENLVDIQISLLASPHKRC